MPVQRRFVSAKPLPGHLGSGFFYRFIVLEGTLVSSLFLLIILSFPNNKEKSQKKPLLNLKCLPFGVHFAKEKSLKRLNEDCQAGGNLRRI